MFSNPTIKWNKERCAMARRVNPNDCSHQPNSDGYCGLCGIVTCGTITDAATWTPEQEEAYATALQKSAMDPNINLF
jgi:hypothetical protein